MGETGSTHTVLEGLKGRDHMRKYVKTGSLFPVALISQDRIMVMNLSDFIISDEFLGQLLEMSTPRNGGKVSSENAQYPTYCIITELLSQIFRETLFTLLQIHSGNNCPIMCKQMISK